MGYTSFAVVIAIILVWWWFRGRGDETKALKQIRNPQHDQQRHQTTDDKKYGNEKWVCIGVFHFIKPSAKNAWT
jgi:hypothetical protein